MANIFVSIEKGIEVGAEDALKWLSSANKALIVAPTVVAALGTLFGQLEAPISNVAAVAANDADDLTVPFGGFKQSGIGRDKSLHALEKYTELKTTWIDLS